MRIIGKLQNKKKPLAKFADKKGQPLVVLCQMVSVDQKERRSFKTFVDTKLSGDYAKGGKVYAKLKNRPTNDIFGEKAKLQKFMKMHFDFTKFSDTDWENYWLLTQHCDFNRQFQKAALKVITKFRPDSDEMKFLTDRISCSLSGTQKFGTQNICEKDDVDVTR